MPMPYCLMDSKWEKYGQPGEKCLEVLDIRDYGSTGCSVIIKYFSLQEGGITYVRLIKCAGEGGSEVDQELDYPLNKTEEERWMFGDERVREQAFRDFADSIGVSPFGLANLIINGAYKF